VPTVARSDFGAVVAGTFTPTTAVMVSVNASMRKR
jgi:hypothetical protein